MNPNVIDLDANLQQRRVHNNEQESSTMNPIFAQSVASSVGNYVGIRILILKDSISYQIMSLVLEFSRFCTIKINLNR